MADPQVATGSGVRVQIVENAQEWGKGYRKIQVSSYATVTKGGDTIETEPAVLLQMQLDQAERFARSILDMVKLARED